MTSTRKVSANRANARRSTGPRTAEGKTRASRNAFRHGLAAFSSSPSAAAPQMEKIANAICGSSDDRVALHDAHKVAEQELLVAQVRGVRVAAIEQYRRDRDVGGALDRQGRVAIEVLVEHLECLERYERRGLSARNRVIGQLAERLGEG